jgi:CheY-like chemotaxis protein
MGDALGAGLLEPLSILVADDNVDAAESLGILLQLEGHTVHLAGDGLQALAVAERVRPDVAVLDVGMPGLDGLQLTRQLREKPWGSGMLIVALTGWGHAADHERAVVAGFDRHFTKPLDPAVLLRCLAEWKARRRSAS